MPKTKKTEVLNLGQVLTNAEILKTIEAQYGEEAVAQLVGSQVKPTDIAKAFEDPNLDLEVLALALALIGSLLSGEDFLDSSTETEVNNHAILRNLSFLDDNGLIRVLKAITKNPRFKLRSGRKKAEDTDTNTATVEEPPVGL